MIKMRQDIEFLILTKRIDRFMVSLPEDWEDGYDNVYLGCTVESKRQTTNTIDINKNIITS